MAEKTSAPAEFAPAAVSPFLTEEMGGQAVNLEAPPIVGKILIRGLEDDPAFLRAAEAALGVALPLVPNTTAPLPAAGGRKKERGEAGVGERVGERVFWMGPSEWLVWTSEREALMSALDDGLSGAHSALADVSDYYAILRLSGDLAREVLAHGCPLDLDESAFGAGSCAQTRFRAAAILLHCADAAPTFEVQMRWSYAEYLRRYFAEAAELCAAARA